jgi:RNA polymerase sigma-70 factor (ECF subfamily)
MTRSTLHKVSSASWDWGELRRFCFAQALRVVGSPDVADEAAQEAILRAWRHRDSCRRQDQPLAWLRRIARNEAMRAVGRRPNEVLVAEPFYAEPHQETEDPLVERLVVTEALATLSQADRELAHLRYYEDLTCATLAERCGLSEATVKVRLHRLRQRLRQTMEGEVEARNGQCG